MDASLQKTRNQTENRMKSIEQLRDKMASAVKALENKEISAEEAMAICRAGAVVIGSLRVELQYRQSRAEKPEIPFMEKSK
jgi:exonuclease VII small subunit